MANLASKNESDKHRLLLVEVEDETVFMREDILKEFDCAGIITFDGEKMGLIARATWSFAITEAAAAVA